MDLDRIRIFPDRIRIFTDRIRIFTDRIRTQEKKLDPEKNPDPKHWKKAHFVETEISRVSDPYLIRFRWYGNLAHRNLPFPFPNLPNNYCPYTGR